MPLDKLQKQILDDARQKAAGIEDAAKKQADEILKQAKEQVREQEAMEGKEIDEELARQDAEYEANAELQEQSILLGAREHAVASLIPKVKALTVKRLKVSGYGKLINLAVKEANAIAPQEELTLVIGKKDAGLVKGFEGKVKYGDVGNGVELYTKDGKIKISAKIEDLFDDSSAEIKTLLIKEAFSKPAERKMAAGKPVKKAKKAVMKVKKAGKGKRR